MSQKKRSIFEEVGSDAPNPSPSGAGVIERQHRSGARLAVRAWLVVLFALVVVMIVVGGLTRLTDSGLSITEWRPVTGAMPPMDTAGWTSEFEKYQQSPQFEIMNSEMTLAEFKSIYWWEWGHRQLGRVIGLVWAVGIAGFALFRQIPPGWTLRLLGLGVLGGLQGAIGWWMVASGLTDGNTSVASYRLAVHLGLAFAILGVIAWDVQLLSRPESALLKARRSRDAKLFGLSTGVMHLALVQILLGALVAGIDAGRSFTDWPLMAGQVFPPAAFAIEPLWRNFFENQGLVQFVHRIVGYLLFAFTIVVWSKGRKSGNRSTAGAFHTMMLMACVQVALGIMTVLYAAPWNIAILHLLGAVGLWVMILRARFRSQYPIEQSVRSAGK
ncbi:heme A synthase [Pseudoruegeria sp. SK021]|uniref:heme A synthase n=1 Tax=Pseudoruegeria sp. SK021 TaxID=1933035 RepID=UPI000A2394E2|nr:heme A synthase [Pseudoruegeria sp. SK021]OSP56362.1 heme A synthase [Pseudoruegeria sp. SK021]